jgi:hypothetical protein
MPDMVHESVIHIKDKRGTVTKSVTLHVDVNILKLAIDPLKIMQEETDNILKQETQVIFKEGIEQQYNFEFRNDYTFKIGVIGMLLAISKGQEPVIPAILNDYDIEDHGFIRIGR